MKTKSSILTAGALAFALAGSLSAGDHKDEFKAMDANSDGNITQAEHQAFSQSVFAKSDADRDASVTAAEWNAACAAQPGEKMDPAETAAQLRTMDVDGNGKISTTESDAFAVSIFAKADKDADGVLTKGEYKAAQKEHKKAKKQQS